MLRKKGQHSRPYWPRLLLKQTNRFTVLSATEAVPLSQPGNLFLQRGVLNW